MSFTSSIAIANRIQGAGYAGRRRGVGATVGITLAMHKSQKSREQLVYAIDKDLMKMSRFLPGDRVDVLIDFDKHKGLIKRVSGNDGWAISKHNTKATTTGHFKMTFYEGMPKPIKKCQMLHPQVTESGIEFTFPPDVEFPPF